MKPFLIYGANGYTGKLILEACAAKGVRPVIAGRNEGKIKPLAQHFGLEYLIFSLEDPLVISAAIHNFALALNCAGPFSRTALPIVEACLKCGSHYLDITGEIEVFERLRTFHRRALERKIVIMPGVGFDVVPTDCVGAYLHEKLPDATHLQLAFMSLGGGISHGTLATMIENLGRSGAVRLDGAIVSKPLGHKGRWIDFGKKKRFAISIPWGDVSTAFHTTGIPNIEVYTAVPAWYHKLLKLQSLYNPLMQSQFIRRLAKDYIDRNVTGPTPMQNAAGRSLVWGKATNAKDESVEIRLEGPESYLLTAKTALLIAERILAEDPKPGFHTPAELFGYLLINSVEGVVFPA